MLRIILGMLFTNLAYADNASIAGAGREASMTNLLFIGALFVIMYFMMIRPQSKRAKEHKELISNLTTGDEVITQGGMAGKICGDAGTFFLLTLGGGVEVPIQKQAILQVLPKGTIKTLGK